MEIVPSGNPLLFREAALRCLVHSRGAALVDVSRVSIAGRHPCIRLPDNIARPEVRAAVLGNVGTLISFGWAAVAMPTSRLGRSSP